MDVKTAFLNDNLVEKVYTLKLERFKNDGTNHLVFRAKFYL